MRTWLAVGLLACFVAEAHGYEFWTSTRGLLQFRPVRAVRFEGGGLALTRQRYTQTLALSVWNIGHARTRAWEGGPTPTRELRGALELDLRLDHDFGSFTSGLVATATRRVDALDVVGELQQQSLAMVVARATARLDGIWDNRVALTLGRHRRVDTHTWYGIDGLGLEFRPQPTLAMEAVFGLRVRQASLMGQDDLDGTPGSGCYEYVEGAASGAGQWRLLTRDRIGRPARLAADGAACPQAQQPMPTAEARLGVQRSAAAVMVGYRVARSPTVGVIGDADRIDHVDTGLYPNEQGQAPAWATNEAVAFLSAEGRTQLGWLALEGRTLGRYDVVMHQLDYGAIGLEGRTGAHSLELWATHQRPTFDSDSLFAMFAVGAARDVRVAYSHAQRGQRWAGEAWHRAFSDAGWAQGARAMGQAQLVPWLASELTLIADRGSDGRRLGLAAALWVTHQDRQHALTTGTRWRHRVLASVTHVTPPSVTSPSALTHLVSWQARATLGTLVQGVFGLDLGNNALLGPTLAGSFSLEVALAPEP